MTPSRMINVNAGCIHRKRREQGDSMTGSLHLMHRAGRATLVVVTSTFPLRQTSAPGWATVTPAYGRTVEDCTAGVPGCISLGIVTGAPQRVQGVTWPPHWAT